MLPVQEAVSAKLHEVWAKCGFDKVAGLSSVQMVAGLEAKLEEFLTASEQLTPEEVTAGQRAREAARRKVGYGIYKLQQQLIGETDADAACMVCGSYFRLTLLVLYG